MLVGQIPRERPLGREHADPTVPAEEHRLLVEVAAQRVERAAAGHHPDGVDPDVLPEFRVAAKHQTFARSHRAGLGNRVIVLIEIVEALVGRHGASRLVIVERLLEFGGGQRGGTPVDFRDGDDLVDRGHHCVPAARDDLADGVPAFAAGPAGELFDTTGDEAQVRVAVEEPCHRGQFAHRPE